MGLGKPVQSFNSGPWEMKVLVTTGGWALKNWYFQTVVLEKTLFCVPWTARRPNQSILKEISPEYSLEGLMLKLKLQYFDYLLQRTDSFEETLILGKIEGRRRDNRRWDGWMTLLTQWTWVWVSSGSSWWTWKPGVLQSIGSQRVWHNWATELRIQYFQLYFKDIYWLAPENL